MAGNKRLASTAVEEAEEAEDASIAVVRHWDRVVAKGVISLDDAREGLRLAREAVDEAHDVVEATMQTDVWEKVAVSALTGRFNPHVQRQADDVGLVIPLFPEMPKDAA